MDSLPWKRKEEKWGEFLNSSRGSMGWGRKGIVRQPQKKLYDSNTRKRDECRQCSSRTDFQSPGGGKKKKEGTNYSKV